MERELAEWAGVQAVGRLAGGVAHDFNNLLTAIVGSAEAVIEQTADSAIIGEMQRMLAAADPRRPRWCASCSPSRDSRALGRVLVALDEALDGMAELMHRLLGSACGCGWNWAQAETRVLVDPTQLDQVVFNLAINARQAMRGGELRWPPVEHSGWTLRGSAGHARRVPQGEW